MLMFSKFGNKFIKQKVEFAVNEIVSHADKCFVGDEMMILNKNMHFLDDMKFKGVLEEIALTEHYRGMAWRLHVLVYASKLALDVPGAFMECGVFRGFKSYFLLKYFAEELENRKYYLLDTFEGIDLNLADGSPISKNEHAKSRLFDFVNHRFKSFANVEIVKGSVPSTLGGLELDGIAFLHLDMNSYQAEIGALNMLWDLIPKHGIIVFDDFGLHSHKEQQINELPWLRKKDQHILEFPTGQGIVIKR